MKAVVRILSIIFLISPIVSCASDTTQTAVLESSLSDVRIAPTNGCLAVSLKTLSLSKNKGDIDCTKSYAIDEKGTRFSIITEPNEYARNYPEPSYFTSDYIWLKGKSGEKVHWHDGTWKVVLILGLSGNTRVYNAEFTLKTSTASLHGFHGWNGDF